MDNLDGYNMGILHTLYPHLFSHDHRDEQRSTSKYLLAHHHPHYTFRSARSAWQLSCHFPTKL